MVFLAAMNALVEDLPPEHARISAERMRSAIPGFGRDADRTFLAGLAATFETYAEAAELPPLPLPADLGGPHMPFGDAVDAYVLGHEVTLAEAFEHIAQATGVSPEAVEDRYDTAGDRVWDRSKPRLVTVSTR
jgi:hypothetical protein